MRDCALGTHASLFPGATIRSHRERNAQKDNQDNEQDKVDVQLAH